MTIDIDAIKRERQKVFDQAQALVDAANGEDRGLTQAEQESFDQLKADLEKRDKQIANHEYLHGKAPIQIPNLGMRPTPDDEPTRIGMAKEDVSGWSLMRAIRAAASGDWREASLERQASEMIAKRLGKQPRPNGFFVPYEVARNWRAQEQRDITITAEGADVMQTDLGSLIDLLRNRMMVARAGARTLTGLRGDLQYPKFTAAATAGWVAENVAAAESTQTFGQVKLVPKQLGAYTDLSRQLILQTSFDIEAAIRDDLASVLAIEIDRAALHGSGAANQPTGVASQSGVNVVALGANGAAPTWASILDLEQQVAIDNADVENMAFITNPKVRYKLKATERATNTGIFIWNDLAPYGTPTTPLNGYPAFVTNQVASNLTKGASGAVCSAVFFGNWSELLIGLWSDVEILVDPYTGGTAGTVRLIALVNADIAVRHGESFAVILDALTT